MSTRSGRSLRSSPGGNSVSSNGSPSNRSTRSNLNSPTANRNGGNEPTSPAPSNRSTRSNNLNSPASNKSAPNGAASPAANRNRANGANRNAANGLNSPAANRNAANGLNSPAANRNAANGLNSPVSANGSPGRSLRSGLSSSPASSVRSIRSIRTPVSKRGGRSLGTPSSAFDSPLANLRRDPTAFRSPLNYGSNGSPSGSSGRTPIRNRPDIDPEGRPRYNVNINTVEGEEPELVIWGTNVSATDFKDKFKRFLMSYREPDIDDDELVSIESRDDGPLYMQKLNEISMLEIPYMNLNCAHLTEYDPAMYRQLVNYPQELIPVMDEVINEIFVGAYPTKVLQHQILIRPFNADKTSSMRNLNPDDIDQLVTISGMVIRVSNILPEMKVGFFKCSVCAQTADAAIDRGKITEPTLCSNCNTNFSFSLIHNRSTFADKQMIRLQEDLDDTPVGETPYMAAVFAHDALVNDVQPGDRITVTGIYRAAPLRLNPRMRTVRTVYKTHLDAVHFRKLDTKRLREEVDGKGFSLSPERIDFIRELSTKPDIYERLARAIAPSIYEHEDVKKGILLQLFGGSKKDFSESGRGRFRSEINILLCGDPGTSKSQLLKYVYDLIPRSQYTSGKGSSAVGLTAYITKDPETRQIVLQTGALVLADNGICCIDEFDKMSDATRSILHEVMEQQTLSIAKAGIICQLNARTSVLAAANPLESQWNKNKTIIDNVHLPHTLLSRFDLIFLLLDPQNDVYDRRLGRHMISLYFQNPEDESADLLDMSVLRDYISYAKESIHPQLSGDAAQLLTEHYVEMRRSGKDNGTITAYPRQLESLIRLSEAHAKIRLSQVVEVVDVEEAIRIHREAIKQTLTDPTTGKIDLSVITTGVSSIALKRKKELTEAMRKVLEGKPKTIPIKTSEFLMEMKENSSIMITREMFEDILKELQEEGILTVTNRSTIKLSYI